ncbi:hypothetical protein M3Y99_00690700 [Aphelenchoides fujianensis]|nr:hypothetical protein M3Y99_00690700 [Aphelenchoides fujianensis]
MDSGPWTKAVRSCSKGSGESFAQPPTSLSIDPNATTTTVGPKKRPPSWSKRLTDFLLSQHSKEAPPDGLIVIEYELELVHILQIDELKQTLTALVYVDQRWTDPSLSWEPADFGGLNRTWLPVHAIWSADVMVVNLISSSRLHADDVISHSPALIYANGTVECTLPAVYTVSCEINIKVSTRKDQFRSIPLVSFSTSRSTLNDCALEVASWSYNEEKLRLHPHLEHNLQHYVPNEVPSYVMCVITIIGLFARASTTSERIERFTLGVMATITSTSTAVLSLVVSEKVPHSSTAIPLLGTHWRTIQRSFLGCSRLLPLQHDGPLDGGRDHERHPARAHRCGRYGDEPADWAMRVCFLKVKAKPEATGRTASAATTPTGGGRKADENNHPLGRSGLEHHGPIPWTEDVVRAHRRLSAITIDSPLQGKLYALEMATRANNYEEMAKEKHRAEYNGYVQIAERMDWFFMVFFLVLLTCPVVYLYFYL